METHIVRPLTTTALGGGWRMTLHRVSWHSHPSPRPDSIQVWCGLARTEKASVRVYGGIEPEENVARAEVIFEPTFVLAGERWVLEESGRTGYVECPGSGEGRPFESALLSLVPLEDLLRNVLVLSLLALGHAEEQS